MRLNEKIIFCNALPSTQESFNLAIIDAGKDFIKHFIRDRKEKNVSADWKAYKLQLIDPYETLKKAYDRYGIKFIDQCDWITYKNLIADRTNNIIIMYSHCILNDTTEECIEFADGMIRSETIADCLLKDEQVIYDFAVCKSPYLRTKTSNLKMKGLLGTSTKYIPLSVWLFIYAETFNKMILKKLDFIDALDKTFRDAETRIKKKL
jgi:hypothetical protein